MMLHDDSDGKRKVGTNREVTAVRETIVRQTKRPAEKEIRGEVELNFEDRKM